MRLPRAAFLVVCLALCASPLTAMEVWLVQFHRVRGPAVDCHQAVWESDVLVYNSNDSAQSIRLLDISNGTLPPPNPPSQLLPVRQILAFSRRSSGWYPRENETLWVIHIDVPDGVDVQNRMIVADDEFCFPDHRLSQGPVASIALPTVRRLTPALVPQVLLGTNVISGAARENVIIYNAGLAEATALIEVRRGCDDAIIEARTVSVPAHSAAQFLGFQLGSDQCPFPGDVPTYVRYTKVTVDQPSFSMASTITRSQQRSVGNVTPLIEVAITASGTL